mgnify:CR=1 FL=1
MAKRKRPDPETVRLKDRLTDLHPNFPPARIAFILSAWRHYRSSFGTQLVSDAVLRAHLVTLFEQKGAAQGYAQAMHLRDALRTAWGDEVAARVTRHVRDIQPRAEVNLISEWAAVRGAAAHLPPQWRDAFLDFVTRCENSSGPLEQTLSPFTLQGMAEALTAWVRFREGDKSQNLTGSDLARYAAHLAAAGIWPSGILAAATKVYMGYKHVLSPGFRSASCRAVLRELKGRASLAGPCRKTPSQIVPARLIYDTGQIMMAEAQTGPSHDMQAATHYRNGLLLTIAAALPLRRRALASLDLASSFRLEARPCIAIDIAGKFLKLRQDRKNYERYQAYLNSPRLWEMTRCWVDRFRPMFDDGTALFPSARVRGEALVSDVLGQVFGDTTKARLGVRVPIHRIRDCVATEAIEEMDHGAEWARHLLGHRSAETMTQFYDHSTGIAVAREFGQLLSDRRSDPEDLIL